MSDLFVDNIKHQSSQGSGTITLGASGEIITTASGAKFSGITGQNYPAFQATMSANQTITAGVATKLVYDTETFDTDNAYDNATNYRFTPQVAGKYQVGMQIRFQGAGAGLQSVILYFYKNGSQTRRIQIRAANIGANQSVGIFTTIVELNGSTDYLEAYVNLGVSTLIYGNNDDNYFSAYRIGA